MSDLRSLWVALLLITVAKSQQCNREYFLQPNQMLNISSINYPAAYPAGSNCRYRIIAQQNHIIQLSCLFEVYPDTCATEFFLVSRDGDPQFRDAERYCRTGRINRYSNYQSMTVGYFSSTPNPQQRARLSCQAMAHPMACDCGWSFPDRIANGVEAARHEFPSMVALRDLTSNQRVFCGGNIVNPRYIVTAAHCTSRQPVASRLMAYVGIHALSSGDSSTASAQYGIRSIINHPAYTVTSSGTLNDIALLETIRPIEWSRRVAPICLPWRQSAETFSYLNVEVAGWGTLGFAAAKSDTLQKAMLLTMENGVCQAQYNASIAPGQLCTYDSRGAGQDSCQYDSGGPVIMRQQQRMYLLGVISYGRVCGQPYGIGVNTRITSYLSWLWRYIGNGVCSR